MSRFARKAEARKQKRQADKDFVDDLQTHANKVRRETLDAIKDQKLLVSSRNEVYRCEFDDAGTAAKKKVQIDMNPDFYDNKQEQYEKDVECSKQNAKYIVPIFGPIKSCIRKDELEVDEIADDAEVRRGR